MEVSLSHQDFVDRPYAFKGKRSKRSRPLSPLCQLGTTVTTSTSTAGGSDDGGGGDFYYSSSIIQYSPTTSTTQISTSSTSEEDEDMANCLILLAQSGGGCKKVQVVSQEVKKDKICSSRKFTEMVSTTSGKAGFYVYECKTCNRTFPSFQALGGHRASHKRPKTVAPEEKNPVSAAATATVTPNTSQSMLTDDNKEDFHPKNDQGRLNKISASPVVKIVNNNNNNDNTATCKRKIHECSICGSEFSSGQALGGHMRRHRPPPPTTTAPIIAKISTNSDETLSDDASESSQKNILSLDLNLPAPLDDDHVRDTTTFDFSANQKSLVFSTTTLVDCHY